MERNNNYLKKISGGLAWSVASNFNDGEAYYLDMDACNTLTNSGYNVKSDLNAVQHGPRPGMFLCHVTDDNGVGIGDNRMQTLLGNPLPPSY